MLNEGRVIERMGGPVGRMALDLRLNNVRGQPWKEQRKALKVGQELVQRP